MLKVILKSVIIPTPRKFFQVAPLIDLYPKYIIIIKTPYSSYTLNLENYVLNKENLCCIRLITTEKAAVEHLFHMFYKAINIFKIFFIKIRVRGLGYRIKNLAKNLLRIFLGFTNYIYVHIPYDVIARARRRRLLLMSWNYNILTDILAHLLLLKPLIPYHLRGIFFPKQIILMKPGKKRAI